MKKRWLAVPVLAGLIAVGAIGGTALAHGTGPGGERPENGLASRVAVILELDEQQVALALQQAQEDIRGERFQSMLDRMVANGRLTQEEANERWAQYQAGELEVLTGHGKGRFGMRGFGGFRGFGGGMHHGHGEPSAPLAGADETSF